MRNRRLIRHQVARPSLHLDHQGLAFIADLENDDLDPMSGALVPRLHDFVADRLCVDVAWSHGDRLHTFDLDGELTLQDIDESGAGMGMLATDEAGRRREMYDVHFLALDPGQRCEQQLGGFGLGYELFLLLGMDTLNAGYS